MSKEYFLIMKQEHFEQELTPLQRGMFTYCELRESNEYETHKDDENYLKLKKEEKKAKRAVQDYLYNKRHNGRNTK